jgi:hypothetical protein
MAPPTGNPQNVLVGIGYVWLAPVTGGTPVAPPADTVDQPTSPWVYIGYTEDGVDFDSTRKEHAHPVDEESVPLFYTIDNTETKIVTQLAESTLENFKTAFGGGVITITAASTGVPGTKKLVLSESINVFSLLLQSEINPSGFWRRIYIPKIISIGKIKQEYNRAKKKQLLGCELSAITPANQIVITDKTALAA